MRTTPLFIEIDPALPEPLHTQVYRGIRSAIADGRIKPQEFLPSTRALAGDLRVGRNTVLRAVDRLKAEGLVEGRVGSGLRVTRAAPDVAPVSKDTLPPAKQAGESTPLPFTVGVPPLDVFPTRTWTRIATQLWRRATAGIIQSSEAHGYPRLREVLADYLRSARGVKCDADRVLITSGTFHSFDILMRAVLRPGDPVLIEDPGRPEVRAGVVAAGGRPLAVPVDRDGFNPALAPSRTAARMVIVASGCHFPSGVSLSIRRRRQLVEWAHSGDAWIIEDDHFAATQFVGRPLPTIHSIDSGERTMFVGSFANLLFPSLRLGYAVVPDALRDQIWSAHMASDQHAPTGSQAIVADFIEAGHFARHLRRFRDVISTRYTAVMHGLTTHCGTDLDPCPASAGIHLLARLSPGLTEENVMSESVRYGVRLQPLSPYRSGVGRPGLVLGFAGWPEERIAVAVGRLARALTAARRKPAVFEE